MSWGRLARWNYARSFGFVEFDYPPGEAVFCHASVLQHAGIEPCDGVAIEFDTELHSGRLRVKWAKRLRTWDEPEADEEDEADPRKIAGRIVHVNEAKRFVFVARDDRRGVRIFCRLNDLQRAGVPAVIGTRVLFEVGERDGRPVVDAIEPHVHADH
ncbi:hypothetical protein IVB34_22100 [Bradyrhizobium sp. 2]|uniref:hypothetical protein n=1 Tax=unclassified Bradyrhizobium TaxID=2631580 RepID=UPI001FF97076|nr:MULTISPECIES: hypothetical protein [unclassified Bradyrhizobium]MCK1445870.1 hypothetical protein [Bradyrhizobium sp. 48]MCK1460979.1 hypothetical protein [Bradyrhizobium sp. 2]